MSQLTFRFKDRPIKDPNDLPHNQGMVKGAKNPWAERGREIFRFQNPKDGEGTPIYHAPATTPSTRQWVAKESTRRGRSQEPVSCAGATSSPADGNEKPMSNQHGNEQSTSPCLDKKNMVMPVGWKERHKISGSTHDRMAMLRSQINDNSLRLAALREEHDSIHYSGDPSTPADSARLSEIGKYMRQLDEGTRKALEELKEIDPAMIAARIGKEREQAKREVRKEKAVIAAAENRAESSRKQEQSEKERLLLIQDTTRSMMDGLSEIYQQYILKRLDKQEALAAMQSAAKVMEYVEEERQQFKNPEAGVAAASVASGAFKYYQHHVALVTSDEQLFTNVDSWEELVPQDDEPICIPPASVQAKLLNGISLSFPFEELKPQISQSAAHPLCHSTRVVLTTLMYMKAAKKAREVKLPFNEVRPPVVFDIGAGHFGAERIQMLKLDARNHDVALHVTLPDANNDDADRLAKVRADPTFLGWNYLPESRRVVMNGMNYCRHLARDCDCMKYYAAGARIALTIHSAYELDQRDWGRIFSFTDTVESAVHIPKPGETLPLTTPEYEWTYAADDPDASILDKCGYLARQLLTGRRVVKLKPLRCGGTSYIHDDLSQVVANGGFHLSKTVVGLENFTQGDYKTAALFGASAAVSATAAAVVGVAAGLPTATVVGTSIVAAAKSAVLTAGWIRFHYERTRWKRPVLVDRTVTAHIASSYSEKGSEEIAHIVRFKCSQPKRLDPRPTESTEVDPTQVSRVTSALVMAKDKLAGMKQMAGALLRDNVGIKATRDTVRHASRVANYICPNEVSQPPWWQKWRWASTLLPIASAAQLVVTLAKDVQSWTSEGVLLAVVSSLMIKLWGGATILSACLSMWWIWDGAARYARV